MPAAVPTRRQPPSVRELPFAEWVCLALVTQKVSHGWALGSVLAPDGEVGRIWTLSRALTYRAIEGLIEKELIGRKGQAAGRGPHRVLLAPTTAGRRAVQRWLDDPIHHLRDVRTELLVKLLLREQAGLDNAPFLLEQQALFEPLISALTSTSTPEDDLVSLWRRESARTVQRFLEQALIGNDVPSALTFDEAGRAAASSQYTVTAVRRGQGRSAVENVVRDRRPVMTAVIEEAAADLDLAPGDQLVVFVRAAR